MRWLAAALLVVPACSFDPGPIGGDLTVTGEVVDFASGQRVAGTASVSTAGLVWDSIVTTEGASFTIERVPEYSTFHVLAAAPPAHRPTFGAAVVVTDADPDPIAVPAVSEAFLAELEATFGVTASAGRGILLAQLLDESGAPRAGVLATALGVVGGPAVDGPYFLDAQMQPIAMATETTASGWTVYYEVEPGVTALAAAGGSNTTVDMPISPVNAGAVTIARARVTQGTVVLPTNVSFKRQVVPIFTRRGCVGCHQGKREGAELGGLKLDGKADKVYDELMEDPTRVVVADPEASLVLTKPLFEYPPDGHPNVTFANRLDPDWLLIKGWIVEGALEN